MNERSFITIKSSVIAGNLADPGAGWRGKGAGRACGSRTREVWFFLGSEPDAQPHCCAGLVNWCSGGDSNPHTLRHCRLKTACLPISPPEPMICGAWWRPAAKEVRRKECALPGVKPRVTRKENRAETAPGADAGRLHSAPDRARRPNRRMIRRALALHHRRTRKAPAFRPRQTRRVPRRP